MPGLPSTLFWIRVSLISAALFCVWISSRFSCLCHLSLSQECWDYRCVTLHVFFMWVLGSAFTFDPSPRFPMYLPEKPNSTFNCGWEEHPLKSTVRSCGIVWWTAMDSERDKEEENITKTSKGLDSIPGAKKACKMAERLEEERMGKRLCHRRNHDWWGADCCLFCPGLDVLKASVSAPPSFFLPTPVWWSSTSTFPALPPPLSTSPCLCWRSLLECFAPNWIPDKLSLKSGLYLLGGSPWLPETLFRHWNNFMVRTVFNGWCGIFLLAQWFLITLMSHLGS